MQRKRQLRVEYAFTVLDADSVCSMISGYKYSFSKCCCSKWYEIIDKAAKEF